MDPESPLKQIRTFQGDVADALGKQKESLFSIQQREKIRLQEDGLMPTPEQLAAQKKRKNFLFLLLGSFTLLVLGGAGAWFGYGQYKKITSAPARSVPASQFISPNSEIDLKMDGLTRETFANNFRSSIVGLPDGELRHTIGIKGEGELAKLLTTTQFLALLESKAPGNLTRAIEPDFMLGAIGESPFIIFKLSSFENAYAGMLAWEKDMGQDLSVIFPKANAPLSVFRDVIVRNKDVRVLEFPVEITPASTSTPAVVALEPVLLYSFFDNNMLIITDRVEALQTLIDRLTRERLSR